MTREHQTEYQKKTGDPGENSKAPDTSFDEVAAAGLTGAVIGGVTVLVLALLLGGGGISSSAAQRIQFGMEELARSHERAAIGAACLNAGHRWEYGRCRYEEDR